MVLQAWGICVTLRIIASAIMRRTGVSGMCSSSPASVAAPDVWDAGRGASGGVGSAVCTGPDSRYPSTSSRVIRPPMPLPKSWDRSILCSWASRLTAGDRRAGSAATAVGDMATWVPDSSLMPPPVGPTIFTSLSRYPVVLTFAGAVGATAGAGSIVSGLVLSRTSLDSTSAMGAPIGIVSPSWARMRSNLPETGEGISIVTLSVTTSTSGSYCSMWSPGCFSHFPMVPSTTDSPTLGSSIIRAKFYHPVCC